jgi:hypothetical protein
MIPSRQEIISLIAETIDELTYIRYMDRLPPRIADIIIRELETRNVINKEIWESGNERKV